MLVSIFITLPACVNSETTVHVVFSNHLDIGFAMDPFTGYDNTVINTYFTEYFPRAIWLDKWMRELDTKGDRYRYMTHSYLISLYLDCPPGMGIACPDAEAVAALRTAVADGVITWHALPHNSQVEVFDVPLLEYALNLTHNLDWEFGLPSKNTLSQRDVPGLTRAAIPVLVSQGVKAVSVGVNAGSAPPGVPKNTPFLWRDAESHTQVLAFWHPGGYAGEYRGLAVDSRRDCVLLEGFEHVLCFAWRGDNAGPPPTILEVQQAYRHLREEFPGARVMASTFDDYVSRLAEAAPHLTLPVVTAEIGDTWIHGVQSDPRKLADYRAVLRHRRRCLQSGECHAQDAAFLNFSRILTKVPEHTWGLDVKKALNDFTNWDNERFHACLALPCPNYAALIWSWVRQAAYIPWALEALPEGHTIRQGVARDIAVREATAALSDPPTQYGAERVNISGGGKYIYSSSGWKVEVDVDTGTFSKLVHLPSGKDWAAGESSLGQLVYSAYRESSYDAIWQRYAYQAPNIADWFMKDFGKLNVSTQWDERVEVAAKLEELYVSTSAAPSARRRTADTGAAANGPGFTLYLKYSFPERLVRLAGAPPVMWTIVRPAPVSSSSNGSSSSSASGGGSWHAGVRKQRAGGGERSGEHGAGGAGEVLLLDVVWQDKTPTRIPEAMWVRFRPDPTAVDIDSWRMHKLGSLVAPDEVVYNGSQSLHAVQDAGVHVRDAESALTLHIGSLDAGLVSPGSPWPFPNPDTPPDLRQGMSYNLVNNVWGTNYIMWVPWRREDVNMTFRFTLDVQDMQQVPRKAATSK